MTSKQHICYSATHINSGRKYIGETGRPLEVRKGEHYAVARKIYEAYINNKCFKWNHKPYKLIYFHAHLAGLDLSRQEKFEWRIEGTGTKTKMQELERDLIRQWDTASIASGFNMLTMSKDLAKRLLGKKYRLGLLLADPELKQGLEGENHYYYNQKEPKLPNWIPFNTWAEMETLLLVKGPCRFRILDDEGRLEEIVKLNT